VTRTPLSRSKGQGHQAALLTAVLLRQTAAAVGVGTCWPWETAATLPSARPRARRFGAHGGWEGRARRGHIVAAARPPTACSKGTYQIFMKFYGTTGHNSVTNRLDLEWPWLKVKGTRVRKIRIVVMNNSVHKRPKESK